MEGTAQKETAALLAKFFSGVVAAVSQLVKKRAAVMPAKFFSGT